MKIFALTILIVCVHATSAAMPGLAVTDGFGAPVEAAIGDKVWEDCNSTTDGSKTKWTFLPATMEGCKAKCKEMYPDVSAAELTTNEENGITSPKCCCGGLTKAQSEMTWCHYANTGSKAYYWLTCATMAEPKPCIKDWPDSVTDAEKLAIYTNGTWDCAGPKSDASKSGASTLSSTTAIVFLTLLVAFSAAIQV